MTKIISFLLLSFFCLNQCFAQSFVYWSDGATDKVERSSLDGSNRQTIIPDLDAPRAIDIDVTNGRIYWADSNEDTIFSADLDGGNIQELVTGLDTPRGLALDLVNNKMYWTEDGAVKLLRRADIDGSNVETIVDVVKDPAISDPRGVDVDPTTGKVYWADRIADTVKRVNADGTGVVETLIDTVDLTNPEGIFLDLTNNQIFIVDDGNDAIHRTSDLDGNGFTDVVTGLDNPRGLFVDPAANKVYWTDRNTDKVQRADSNALNSNVEDLFTGLNGPNDVAVNTGAGTLFWIDDGNDCIHTGSSAGGGMSTIVAFESQNARGLALDQNNNFLFITDDAGDTIQKLDLDGGNPTTIIVNNAVTMDGQTPITTPRGIVYHAASNKIFWEDRVENTIKTANADGTGISTILDGADGLANPDGLALDSVNNKIYWTDDAGATNHIRRADLDGMNVETIITGVTGFEGVAVDPVNGKVYWADKDTDKIQRADSVGLNMNVEDIVTGLDNPDSVTLDVAAGKVYWTEDGAVNKVRRADMVGLNMNVEDIISTDLDTPRGITLLIDVTPPAAPVITSPVNASTTNDNMFAVVGTAEANSLVEVFDGVTSLGTTMADASGDWTFNAVGTYTDGLHSLTATATDGANNTGPASSSVEVTVDTVAPDQPTVMTTDGDTLLIDNTPELTGMAEAGATVEVFVDGMSIGTTTADANGVWSLEVPNPLSNGSHDVTVVATDLAGNVSVTSTNLELSVASGCDISNFSASYLEMDGSATDLEDLQRVASRAGSIAARKLGCTRLSDKRKNALRNSTQALREQLWQDIWNKLPLLIAECAIVPTDVCSEQDTSSTRSDIDSNTRKLFKKVKRSFGACGTQTKRGKRILNQARNERNDIFDELENVPETAVVCE